ncbi:MAG: hypothetical protein ACR2NX_04080 [Chthoniobacterales bacterium]
MSDIEKLRSLNEGEREELKELILEFSQKLIADQERQEIVSGDLDTFWDEVDEVRLDEISMGPE